jgi:hypothetical protein
MANYTPPASFSTSHATATSQAPSSSALPPDISPATLDTLPILASILSRLQTGPSSATAALPLTQNGSPHVSQSQTLHAASTSSPFASAAATKDLQTGPLTTKDIPAATDDLKSGLKKARALVAQLPDMDRGVEEQEVEIRELEARIEEQRRVLEGLKAMGGGGLVET